MLTIILTLSAVAAARAQSGPFGGSHPTGGGFVPQSGLMALDLRRAGDILLVRCPDSSGRAKRAAPRRGDCSDISFLYGTFHAVGPGHGKAVISSYLVANEETWRRGVILSFISAAIQSAVAIIVVAIAAVLLGATAKAIGTNVSSPI